MTAAIGAHSGPAESVLALFAGPDLGVFCRSYLAHLAWHREDGNRADSYAAEADRGGASACAIPFSQAIALDYAALLHAFRGESRAALERGREAVELCGRHGFAYYLAMANILTGLGGSRGGRCGRRPGATSRGPRRHALAWAPNSACRTISTLLAETLGSRRPGWRGPGQPLHRLRIREQERRGMGARGVASRAGRICSPPRESPKPARASFRRGIEAARRSGSLAFERKLSILARRNGRRHLYRTLLERRRRAE